MSNQQDPIPAYRIKTVASMTGLSTHAIRKWEERYHLVHPQRGPNGYRTFTEDDVQFLLYLKSQLTNGETIGQLAESGETIYVRPCVTPPTAVLVYPINFKLRA